MSFTLELPSGVDPKSYCLGLFDGEGCIATAINHNRSGAAHWYMQISCVLASEPAARFMQATWGGNVSRRNVPTVGGLYLWAWSIGATAGIPFLEYVAEHGIVKREQARIGLELARRIASYLGPGNRLGVNAGRGQKYLSEQEDEARRTLILNLRALNGGRSRWSVAESSHI